MNKVIHIAVLAATVVFSALVLTTVAKGQTTETVSAEPAAVQETQAAAEPLATQDQDAEAEQAEAPQAQDTIPAVQGRENGESASVQEELSALDVAGKAATSEAVVQTMEGVSVDSTEVVSVQQTQDGGEVVNAVQNVMAPKPSAPPAEEGSVAGAEPEYRDSMPSDDEVNDLVADASTPEGVDPSMKLQELIWNFETNGLGRRFLEMQDKKQLFYTTAFAPVNVKASSKDWVDHRVSAFRAAFVDAQAKYLEYLSTSVRARVVKSLDQDSRLPEFTEEEIANPSKLASLVNKLLALGGGILDEKLKEMGIDPSEYDAAPLSKKKQLMMKGIEQQTCVRSMAELVGVVPVKTFEAHDENGNYVVAVAIVASPKFRAFAKEVLENRENVQPNPLKVGGPSVRDQILREKKALLHEFGIRRIYDEDGYPVLISYGQSGNGYVGEDFQMRMHYREAAYDFAKNQALANFALLMDAFGNASRKTSENSQVQEVATATLNKDSVFTRTDTFKEMIKILNRRVEVQGSIHDFPGIRELSRWTLKHPENGQEVDGVVFAWSPRSAALAQELKRDPMEKPAAVQPKQQASGTAGSNVSKDFMSPDDF